MLATGLRDGTLKLTDFDKHYGPGAIHELSRCVSVYESESITDWGSRIVITLNNATVLTDEISDLSRFAFEWDEAEGNLAAMTSEWPFSDSQTRYQTVKGLIQHFENAQSVEALLDLLRP